MKRTLKGTAIAATGTLAMVYRTHEPSKARATALARAWAAQAGCYRVELIDMARGHGAMIRVFLEAPANASALPDDCSLHHV